MPPKKRRMVTPNAPPGIGKSHLQTRYCEFPNEESEFKNGHVLFIHCGAAGNSWASCERMIKEHFKKNVNQFSSKLRNRGKKLVKKTSKLRKLSNPKEFASYCTICEESFKVSSTGSSDEGSASYDGSGPVTQTAIPPEKEPDTLANPDMHTPVASTSSSHQSTTSSSHQSTTSTSTRSTDLTPRKAKMKKRLDFLAKSIAEMRANQRGRLQTIRKNMKTQKIYFNQVLRRKVDLLRKKDTKIKQLRRQLTGNQLYEDLQKMARQLKVLKKKHDKVLKHSEKLRLETVSLMEHKEVIMKLKEKNTVIKELQTKILELEEQNKDQIINIEIIEG